MNVTIQRNGSKTLFIFLIFLLTFGLVLTTQAQEKNISIGKEVNLKSEVLGESRDIFIYVPNGYQAGSNHYPVLYILDGNGHFHYGTGGVNFLSRNGHMPQMIVVGIPNTNRNRDFTPTLAAGRANGGGAKNFQNFLKTELFPYIEQNYRTAPYRILFGHSLTAMFSVYTMMTQPDLFNAYIAASPWVIYDNNYLVKKAPELLEQHSRLNKFLYMTVGNEPNLLPAFNQFMDVLKSKAPAGLNYKYQPMPNDDHGSLTLSTLHDGLRNLFNNWKLPGKPLALKQMQDHYKNLSEKFGYPILPSERIVNILGYRALRAKKPEQAVELFKYNVERFPESANVYDSLGEGLEANNRLEKARENYKIAVQKGQTLNDPNLQIFREHLDNINKKLSGE